MREKMDLLRAGCPTLSPDFGEGWESSLGSICNPTLSQRTRQGWGNLKPSYPVILSEVSASFREAGYAVEGPLHCQRYKLTQKGILTMPLSRDNSLTRLC
jgi:hypothetical protein